MKVILYYRIANSSSQMSLPSHHERYVWSPCAPIHHYLMRNEKLLVADPTTLSLKNDFIRQNLENLFLQYRYILKLQIDSLHMGNILKKLKHGSVITVEKSIEGCTC